MTNIEINRKDAIEALTETEAAILDVLVSKVQSYTQERELKEQSKSAMIKMFAEKTGIPVHNLKVEELGDGFAMLINELNPFEDLMGIPMMEKKEKVDSSIFNLAFDMMLDPSKYDIAKETEETTEEEIKQIFSNISNPFILRLLLEQFK